MRAISCLPLVVLLFTAACDATGPSAPPVSSAPKRIGWGAGPQQYGDLRLPRGQGPFPLAVIIHGGCWKRSIASLQFMDNFAQALSDAGWATWNIEYRGADDPGGGWPTTFQDVAAAVDYSRTLAYTHALDLQRLVLIGHSAGGHLALWAGNRSRLPPDSVLTVPMPQAVTQVIGLGAITDLEGYRNEGGSCADAIPTLTGETTPTAARLAESSPLAMLPSAIPVLLLTGNLDSIVPAAQADRYVVAAGNAEVRQQTVAGDHFSLIVPGEAAWQAMMEALSPP